MIRNNGPAYKDSNVVIQTNKHFVSNNKARKSNQEHFPNQNILLKHFHSFTSFPTSTHPKGSHSSLVPAIQLRMCSTLEILFFALQWWNLHLKVLDGVGRRSFPFGKDYFQYFQSDFLVSGRVCSSICQATPLHSNGRWCLVSKVFIIRLQLLIRLL